MEETADPQMQQNGKIALLILNRLGMEFVKLSLILRIAIMMQVIVQNVKLFQDRFQMLNVCFHSPQEGKPTKLVCKYNEGNKKVNTFARWKWMRGVIS